MKPYSEFLLRNLLLAPFQARKSANFGLNKLSAVKFAIQLLFDDFFYFFLAEEMNFFSEIVIDKTCEKNLDLKMCQL